MKMGAVLQRFVCTGLMMGAVASNAEAGDAHFRWGIGGGPAFFVPGPSFGVTGSLRLGGQINEKFGVYGDLGFLAGFGVSGSSSEDSAAASISGVALTNASVLGEAAFGNFFVAAGPSLAFGGWGYTGATVTSDGTAEARALGASGPAPGLHVRTGLIAGQPKENGKLGGFSVALDMKAWTAKATLANATETDASAEIKRSLGFTPGITFGYELR